jgi:hypothetical protein
VAAPKEAMVYQDGVGLQCHRSLDQGQTGSHAAYKFFYGSTAFDLQAVGTVVFKARGLQDGVQDLQQFTVVRHGENLKRCSFKEFVGVRQV